MASRAAFVPHLGAMEFRSWLGGCEGGAELLLASAEGGVNPVELVLGKPASVQALIVRLTGAA